MSVARRNLKEADAPNSDSTNRNRIQGQRGGVTRQWTGTPNRHPDTHGGKSGEARVQHSRLTLGDLPARPDEPDYRVGNAAGWAREKSAEAVVDRSSMLVAPARGGPTYLVRATKGRTGHAKEQ